MNLQVIGLKEGRGVGKIRDKRFLGSVQVISTDGPKAESCHAKVIIDCRFYTPVHGASDWAIIWLQGPGTYARGVSTRCDYSNDAVAEALENAGVQSSGFDWTNENHWKALTELLYGDLPVVVAMAHP
jgi:hypothetical protein